MVGAGGSARADLVRELDDVSDSDIFEELRVGGPLPDAAFAGIAPSVDVLVEPISFGSAKLPVYAVSRFGRDVAIDPSSFSFSFSFISLLWLLGPRERGQN